MPPAKVLEPKLPRLTKASATLTRAIEVVNEHGLRSVISIPAERSLTLYVDKRELVTLMTLGARPELLVLGYLRNQRLVESLADIESVTVDWEVGAAAVRTRSGIDRIEERTSRRVVTTGCGQGTVFGALLEDIDAIRLPPSSITQADLYAITNTIRLMDSTYKAAGSVHGCALFRGREMLVFVEDVGRHNAMDTISGWAWMQGLDLTQGAAGPGSEQGEGASLAFYTTGRLTSEMVIKSAQMGVAIVISRSGITEMGHDVAQRLGLCVIGRALNKHFLCYAGAQRLIMQPGLAGPVPAPLRVAA
jgi:FdhD protein